MARGEKCPSCKELTYHNQGGYNECSKCKYMGWAWNQQASGVGSGCGNKCPFCKQLTLHDIKQVTKLILLRRCTTCNYTALERTSSSKAQQSVSP